MYINICIYILPVYIYMYTLPVIVKVGGIQSSLTVHIYLLNELQPQEINTENYFGNFSRIEI
jgi:hypothetical protein